MGQSVVRSSHDFWGPDSFFDFFSWKKNWRRRRRKKIIFSWLSLHWRFFLHLKVSPGMKCEHPTMSVVSQKITFYWNSVFCSLPLFHSFYKSFFSANSLLLTLWLHSIIAILFYLWEHSLIFQCIKTFVHYIHKHLSFSWSPISSISFCKYFSFTLFIQPFLFFLHFQERFFSTFANFLFTLIYLCSDFLRRFLPQSFTFWRKPIKPEPLSFSFKKEIL